MRCYHIFIFLLLLGCGSETVAPAVPDPDLLVLQGFFEDFLHEADIRNVALDTSGFTVKFTESLTTSNGSFCGTGIPRRGVQPPFVLIATKLHRCWKGQDIFFKKELLFHEFGHALLGRWQDNGTLPNGEKRSIMAQGILGIFRSQIKSQYYLDELFDPATPVPDWAK